MQFSDEDLIAYLLGDAASELAQRIELQLRSDAGLVDRLKQLRAFLGQIDCLAVTFSPPADLVDSTLARIDRELEQPAQEQPAQEQSAQEQSMVELAASPRLLSAGNDATPQQRSFWDSTALTLCLVVLCCLALPALVRIRFESRKAQCARNLTLAGADLIGFAMLNSENRFPHVATEGPEAFAGVYAVHLRDSGFELKPQQLKCASLLGYEGSNALVAAGGVVSDRIPSFKELHEFALHELEMWQRVIGGDYAYNLGVEERGMPRAPRCEGRSQMAILADAPIIADAQEEFVAHDGRGINILFEDGRVVFVSTKSLDQSSTDAGKLADNPFNNQRGEHEVGVNLQDASLAPSHFPPLRK